MINCRIQKTFSEYQHIIGRQGMNYKSSKRIPDNIANIVRYYEDIISSMPGNVYWLDKEGKTVGCNKNVLKMFGLTSLEQFKNLSFEDLGRIGQWTPSATQSFKNDTLEVIHTGKPKLDIEEPPIPDEHGKQIYFLTSRVPLFDAHGRVIGVVGISIDITDRKIAEAREKLALQQLKLASIAAQSASRAKVQFVQNMQHDIRTPASGIWAVLADLVEKEEDPSKLEKLILLRNSAKQLLHICNEVIAFDKTDRGDLPFLSKKIALKQLASKVVELNQAAAFKKGIHLSLAVDEHVPHIIKGDEHRVSRILINLLGNAIKFTDKGSVLLSIALIKELGKEVILQFAIQDTGVGIPNEKKNFIYEKFNRLTPANQGVYSGSGLGLRIVKQYVAELGGELEVSSEVGKGTIFYISIPFEKPLYEKIYDQSLMIGKEDLIEDNIATFFPCATFKTETSSKNNSRILFIEDDLLSSIVTQNVLESIFSEIRKVSTVDEAKRALNEIKFDIVLSDIGLPDGSGLDVIQHVKMNKDSINYATPFIALTAHNDFKKIKDAKKFGFRNVLIKPFRKEFIKSVISRYIKEENQDMIEEDFSRLEINLADSSVIDIEFTRNLFGEDKNFTIETIKALKNQLPKEIELIQEYYSKNEIEKLSNLLEHLTRSLCYCSVPGLQQAIDDLHKMLEKVSSLTQIENLFNNLYIESQRLLEVLKQFK